MGITGLLPYLKSIQKDVHISAFKGMKVAVDAYCWLHKGSYSCATQIVMKTEKVETLPFINYCLRRVKLLLQHNISPIMVFDGGYLPTKANTEKERRERRKSYLSKGKELLKQSKKSEANDCFRKCVDISPEMALAFIKECRKLGVECIVAPYEADAQLAYLSKEDIVDAVITEDSDLLVFGSKRVFFKMDESGNGKLIELKDLGKANKNLVGFTEESFRKMCILSGCDYLSSVHGIGLGKASKLMRQHNQNSTQVIRALRYDNCKVPENYETDFKKADYTFLYQLVFDPRSQKQVRLNELPDGIDPSEFEFAGIEHSPKKAVHLARGNINPITQEVIDVYSPSKVPSTKSIPWSGSAMGSANKKYPVAIQAKLSISSSAQSSKPFKPPSKMNADESLQDNELMSIYSNSSSIDSLAARAPEQPPSLSSSKYFASQPLEEDNNFLSDTNGYLKFCAPRHDGQESDGNDENHSTSFIESSGRVRKCLFKPGSSKLSMFAFTNKKRKTQDVDHIAEENSHYNRNNPFSVAATNRGDSDVSLSANGDAEEDCNNNTSRLKDNFQTSHHDAVPLKLITVQPTMPDSQPSHTHSTLPFKLASVQPTSLDSQPSETHSTKPTRPFQANQRSTGKIRRQSTCRRVGLSKKAKPQRLSDPGPGQFKLSAFNFVRKPQMKI